MQSINLQAVSGVSTPALLITIWPPSMAFYKHRHSGHLALGTVTSAGVSPSLPRAVGVPPASMSSGPRRPYENASLPAQAQPASWLPFETLSRIIAPSDPVMMQAQSRGYKSVLCPGGSE
jgi:hypothetical protein